MSERTCAECGTPFVPRENKVRFCSAHCRIEWFAKERRQAVQLLRAQRSNPECSEAQR